jgi:hypothetical protein
LIVVHASDAANNERRPVQVDEVVGIGLSPDGWRAGRIKQHSGAAPAVVWCVRRATGGALARTARPGRAHGPMR